MQLSRMTDNPKEIPSIDEYLRKCDADVLVPAGGICGSESRMDRAEVEIAHNGVRSDDDVKATGARPVSNGVTRRL